LDETQRTQIIDLGWDPAISNTFRRSLEESFPEALVEGYEGLLPSVTNEAKDKHVLAAAIHGRASLIVTYNLRDFRMDSISPWKIEVKHPQDYLMTLYSMHPVGVIQRLGAIAAKRESKEQRKCELADVLLSLGRHVPKFSEHVLKSIE
jgi:hypothetical protein